jgi:hypothetical protein
MGRFSPQGFAVQSHVQGRLPGARLAVPGVIEVLHAPGVSYARHGPDVGWPGFQPLDTWEGTVLLVEQRSIPLKARAALSRMLPDEALARALATNADLESYELPPPHGARELFSLRLANASRLWVVSAQEQQALNAHNVPVYQVSHSRSRSSLFVEIFESWRGASMWGLHAHHMLQLPLGAPPPGLSREQHRALFQARWLDRALRVSTRLAVTEGAVRLALRCHQELEPPELLTDEVVPAAVQAAAQMYSGVERLHLPMHGLARRVHLPDIQLPFEWEDPPDSGRMIPGRLSVPAEDCWLVDG